MPEQMVRLSVPAQARYARTVRMMAASLAALCDMSMDDVEDVRMAAEEGFVYSCATSPESCEVCFELASGEMRASFALGSQEPEDADGSLGLAELLLAAVCDEHGVSDDGAWYTLVKRAGAAHDE